MNLPSQRRGRLELVMECLRIVKETPGVGAWNLFTATGTSWTHLREYFMWLLEQDLVTRDDKKKFHPTKKGRKVLSLYTEMWDVINLKGEEVRNL